MKTKETDKIYRNALAVYLNVATDNLKTWFNMEDKDDDANRILKDINQNKEKQSLYIQNAEKNIYFIEYLLEKKIYFNPKGNGEIDWTRLVNLIDILFSLRNFWTHIRHTSIEIKDDALRDMLEELYLKACANSKTSVPEKYKGLKGIFKSERTQDKEEKLIPELSLTGTVFFCCLFLEGGQISSFLELMEQSNYTFEELNKRTEFRLDNPKAQYPENLRKQQKDFFYARDVYNYWKVRGHRSHLLEDKDEYEKIEFFARLEYLKRCPREYLRLKEIQEEKIENREKHLFSVNINGIDYDIRERNKFMDWGLEFIEEEFKRLGIKDRWKWARNQIADKKKETRRQLEIKSQTDGRPYRFPRHKKIVFDIPQNREERINYRNDEHGYSYFFVQDCQGNDTQAMFMVLRGEQKAIGLMSPRMLCSVLEYYFATYPVTETSEKAKKESNKFWNKFINACYQHIAESERKTNQKGNITPQKIERRIKYLEEKYEEVAKTKNITIKVDGTEEDVDVYLSSAHQRVLFILDTWNQILSWGQTTNMEHAIDRKGKLGGKSGYMELQRLLSLLDTPFENKRAAIRKELNNTLMRLGSGKSGKTYFYTLKNNLDRGKDFSSFTVQQHFKLCYDYRRRQLDKFRNNLNKEFNIDDWRPAYEMRWLKLKDRRTLMAAHPSGKKRNEESNTGIVNIDKKQYSAVGMPHDITQLNEKEFQIIILQNNQGIMPEKIHEHIDKHPQNCTLFIPDFFRMPDGQELNKARGNQPLRRKLFLIKRQDIVLANIAYRKGTAFMEKKGKNFSGFNLHNYNYQTQSLQLPVSDSQGKLLLNLSFLYRYYKQNRYQLPPYLCRQIAAFLVSNGFIAQGETLPFNAMKAVLKDKMSYQDREALLSETEKKLPYEEKARLMQERFESISNTIIKHQPEKGQLYFNQILQSYTICRRAFISAIQRLEMETLEKYPIHENKEGYVKFKDITQTLRLHQLIDSQEEKVLTETRNAVFHGKIPENNYMPPKEKIRQKTKEGKQDFFNYFGCGIELVNRIMENWKEEKQKKGK